MFCWRSKNEVQKTYYRRLSLNDQKVTQPLISRFVSNGGGDWSFIYPINVDIAVTRKYRRLVIRARLYDMYRRHLSGTRVECVLNNSLAVFVLFKANKWDNTPSLYCKVIYSLRKPLDGRRCHSQGWDYHEMLRVWRCVCQRIRHC